MSRLPNKVKSLLAKRSVVIGTRKTSVTLETAFWEAVKEIAAHEGASISALVTGIDEDRKHANLSSAIRLYVLEHYRRLADTKAGGQADGIGE
jgi:predicted DNA-binding ribbon-helix-helix protein